MKKMLMAAAIFLGLALETWIARRSDSSDSRATTPSPTGWTPELGELTASPSSNSDPRRVVEESNAAGGLEPAGTAERAASSEPPIERETMRHRLTTAIEVSLSGGLDPEAILSAGLALVKLHVDRTDLPIAAPDGSLRYPLADSPSGVKAELWVTRSSNAKFENVLALRLQVDPPSEPYLLEGAVRKGPVAHIQAFLNKSGEVKDLVIMTDVAPSGRSRKWGLSLDEGRIPEGIIYHLDMDDPLGWTAETYGLVDGAEASWKEPIALLGEPFPRAPALAQFSSGLLNLLSEVRQ